MNEPSGDLSTVSERRRDPLTSPIATGTCRVVDRDRSVPLSALQPSLLSPDFWQREFPSFDRPSRTPPYSRAALPVVLRREGEGRRHRHGSFPGRVHHQERYARAR